MNMNVSDIFGTIFEATFEVFVLALRETLTAIEVRSSITYMYYICTKTRGVLGELL